MFNECVFFLYIFHSLTLFFLLDGKYVVLHLLTRKYTTVALQLSPEYVVDLGNVNLTKWENLFV